MRVSQILLAILGLAIGAGAQAEIFALAAEDGVIGQLDHEVAVYEDTLTDIARRHGLGYQEIVWANPGVDPWLPGAGTRVTLPTQFLLPSASRDGLVVNLAEYRMYSYTREQGGLRVSTFPISIGRMDWSTPLGRSTIVNKAREPAWYPPDSVRKEYAEEGRTLPRVVPPGPDNPLGKFAMRLSIPGYLIHGTNRPAGVGMRVTHGCIRMYPEDIEWLFPRTPVETSVRLINEPIKIDWSGPDLYLEVHPPLEDTVDEPGAKSMTAITELYVEATRDRSAVVDWALVDEVFRRQDGIPVRIGTGSVVTSASGDDGKTADSESPL